MTTLQAADCQRGPGIKDTSPDTGPSILVMSLSSKHPQEASKERKGKECVQGGKNLVLDS